MALTVRTDAPDFLGTTYGIENSEAVVDMRPKIAELDPNDTPFTTLMMHPDFPSRKAYSVKCEWLEHETLPVTSTTNTDDSGTGTAVSIVVAAGTGAYFKGGDLIRMESTGELMSVTSVATDTLTVVRGVGNGGTGVDWGTTNALVILRVCNVSTQGATLPEIRMTNTVALFNYTWIQRDPFGQTRSAAMTKRWGGDPEARERKTKAIEHKRAQEHNFFVGKRDLLQVSSRPKTFMGGLLYYITANITTVGGNLTAANLETYCRSIFRYGSNRKFAFCSPLFMSAVAFFSIGKTALSNWDEGSKQYGIKAKKFVSGAGDELILVNKRPWNDLPQASPGLGGTAVVLDLDGGDIALREFLPTTLFENRHARDFDGFKHELISELSLEVCHGGTGGSNQGKHAVIRGVTGYA